MNAKTKKGLAILLVFAMLFSIMPIGAAWAEGEEMIKLSVSSPLGKNTELTIAADATFAQLKEKIEKAFEIDFEEDNFGIYCSAAKIYYDHNQPADTATLDTIGIKDGYAVYVEKNGYWTATEENPIKIFGITITGGTGCCEPYGDYKDVDYYWNYYYRTLTVKADKYSWVAFSGTAEPGTYFIMHTSYATFDNLTLSCDNGACLVVNANAKVYLYLKGSNTFTTTGGTEAPIQINNSSSTSKGKLLVYDYSDYKTDNGYGGSTLTVNSTVDGVPAIQSDTTTAGLSVGHSGVITANGGKGAPGIKATKLSITGGMLIANGGEGSSEGINIKSSLGINGGIVKTSTITAEQQAIEKGIVFYGTTGTVTGNANLDINYTLLDGETLTIPEGASLTIPSGKTLAIESGAVINNSGTIINNGTINNSGTINTLCTDTNEYPGSGVVNRLHDENYAETGYCSNCATFSIVEDVQTHPYDGTEKTFTITGTDITGFDIVYQQNGETVTPVNAGTYDVIITRAEDATYKAFSKTVTGGLVITAKEVTAPTITLSADSYTYDGTAKEPTVTVKDGDTVIPVDEYTVTYSNNINAGTPTVTITDKEGGNYTITEQSATFTIVKSSSDTGSSSSSSSGGFTGDYNYPVALSSEVDDATVSFSEEYAVPGETVTITVTPDEGKAVTGVIITDEDGNVITATKVGDNEYTFTMPKGKVNVQVLTGDAAYSWRMILQVGNTLIWVNDDAFRNDVAPVIVDDRTMVPIRVITETLGGKAHWDEATRTVTLEIDDKVLTLTIGEEIPGFGAAPIILNSRTYVPVRYVAEYMGYDVEWIAETQQVVIVK